MAKHIESKLTASVDAEAAEDDAYVLTVKTMLAGVIQTRMTKLNIGVSELARRMKTGRVVAYRLLDANDTGVTLKTMCKAAVAVESSLIDLLRAIEQN